MINLSTYKWLDPGISFPEGCESLEKEAKDILNAINKKDWEATKKNYMVQYYFKQLNQYNKDGRLSDWKISKDLNKEFKSWEKSSSYKKLKETLKSEEITKFTISSAISVIAYMTFLFFFKAVISQNFMISFSVDAIVGAGAILFLFRNYRLRHKLYKRYIPGNQFLYMDASVGLVCLLIKTWLPLYVDFTLIVLLIDYFITRNKFQKVVEKY